MDGLLIRLVAVLLLLTSGAVLGQKPDGIVTFKLPVLPEAGAYLDLLEVPAYLVLALENNDLAPSLSSRIRIPSRQSAQIHAGVLTFKERSGTAYRYEAGLNLPLGVANGKLIVPAEVETKNLTNGIVEIRISPPLAALLPQGFIDRVDFKIRSLANESAQRRVLAYLERLAAEQKAKGGGRESLYEAIAFDAYNRTPIAVGAGGARSQGISGPMALFVATGIWVIGFPFFFLVVRRRSQRRQS